MWLWYEGSARHAYVEATHEIGRERWIEKRHYLEAIEAYSQVKSEFRFSTTSLYDVRRQLEQLLKKQELKEKAIITMRGAKR